MCSTVLVGWLVGWLVHNRPTAGGQLTSLPAGMLRKSSLHFSLSDMSGSCFALSVDFEMWPLAELASGASAAEMAAAGVAKTSQS